MTSQIKAFSLFYKRLNKMRDMTEKDALAPPPYLQNNTALATLSSSTYTHTGPFKAISL